MVTREQYLEALDKVETYYQQLRHTDLSENNLTLIKLTPIQEWDKLKDCSTRLKNILINIKNGTPRWNNYQEDYIEKIDHTELKLFPNCGNVTLAEFFNLRGY